MSGERKRPTSEQLARYADEFNRSRTLEHFGVRIEFPDLERVRVHLDPIRPEQRGGLGSDAVNGGVLAAIFDLAIGCTPALIDPTQRAATVQLSMRFEHPVRGERVLAEAVLDRHSRNLIFSSAWISDPTGRVCARCQGMCVMGNKPWASGGSPAID